MFNLAKKMSNFAMETILGECFAQAQLHTEIITQVLKAGKQDKMNNSLNAFRLIKMWQSDQRVNFTASTRGFLFSMLCIINIFKFSIIFLIIQKLNILCLSDQCVCASLCQSVTAAMKEYKLCAQGFSLRDGHSQRTWL